MNFLLENALVIAAEAHVGQVDRAGVDYMCHVNQVVENVRAAGGTVEMMVVAALHDVLEDTDFLVDDMRMIFGDEITDAVLLLTKDGAPIELYYENIKENEIARAVKIADMNHNRDLNRLVVLTEADYARAAKYEFWIEFLEN